MLNNSNKKDNKMQSDHNQIDQKSRIDRFGSLKLPIIESNS